jgi:hypothetical protein
VFIDGDSVGFGHQHFKAVPGTSEMENHAVKDHHIKKPTYSFHPVTRIVNLFGKAISKQREVTTKKMLCQYAVAYFIPQPRT